MASDEQRARLLHASLVKASECEKCSWTTHETKGCRECLGPHYDTCRLKSTNLPIFNLMNKRVNFTDWNLIRLFPDMFTDADTEAKDCQIGEVVVNSRGRGSSHAPPSSASGVRGVNKTLIQEVTERKAAVWERGWSKEAEKSEESPVVVLHDCSFQDRTALRGIAKALDGETGTGWTTIEPGSTIMGKHRREEESQGPEKEFKCPRTGLNSPWIICDLHGFRRPRMALAQCYTCEKFYCRKCLEGDFECDGGTGLFECKVCWDCVYSNSDSSE